MPKKENILVICAHSDDHILGAGGTIAKYASEGKKVRAIILSYGEKSHPWLRARFTKETRLNETKQADRIVGCRSTFFDLKEGRFMEDYPEIKNRIVSILEKENPKKVFTHSSEDPHPDHSSAFNITCDSIGAASIKPEVYLFSIWNPFSVSRSNDPKMYVDITKTHKKKMVALSLFKSQWAALSILIWGIFAREVKNGLQIGTLFAERFYKHR